MKRCSRISARKWFRLSVILSVRPSVHHSVRRYHLKPLPTSSESLPPPPLSLRDSPISIEDGPPAQRQKEKLRKEKLMRKDTEKERKPVKNQWKKIGSAGTYFFSLVCRYKSVRGYKSVRIKNFQKKKTFIKKFLKKVSKKSFKKIFKKKFKKNFQK